MMKTDRSVAEGLAEGHPLPAAPARGGVQPYESPRLVRHGSLVELVQQLPSGPPPPPGGRRRPGPRQIFPF